MDSTTHYTPGLTVYSWPSVSGQGQVLGLFTLRNCAKNSARMNQQAFRTLSFPNNQRHL